MWPKFEYSIFVCAYLGFLFLLTCVSTERNMLVRCHDDPTFEPLGGPIQELQFTWLGTLQYIHIKNETPHYFRVPRVVLVAKQFTLCAAHDVTPVPNGYALGNIAFGEYERDEQECGLTVDQIASGIPCDPVMLLMPIADVFVHPEYSPYGAKHSLALLKLLTPVVSKYMIPVCLPLRSYLEKTTEQRISSEIMYHVDYSSPVPRVFADEVKRITVVTLLPDDQCKTSDFRGRYTEGIIKETQICTSGCGLNSGAPSIIHETTGQWTLVSISLGGSWCADPLIYHPSPPPHHLLIFPYLHWITHTITGKETSLRNDPFGLIVPRVTHYQRLEEGWVGHWWLGGISCYDRGYATLGLFRFYHEIFTLEPEFVTNLTYYIERLVPKLSRGLYYRIPSLSPRIRTLYYNAGEFKKRKKFFAPPHVMVKCIKVGMPIQLAKPRVWELLTSTPKLRIPIRNVSYEFRFEIEAWGTNATEDLYPAPL